MRPDYKLYVPFVLKWEGGYVNDPVDRGGETNMGITRATFDSLASRVLGITPNDSTFRALTKDQASLFVKYFWDKATYNNSINSQIVAEAITSWNWGSGALGLREFQKMLNEEYGFSLTVDGVIGPQTVKAANSISARALFNKMLERRETFFLSIVDRNPSQARFINGWLNRLNDFADRHKKKFSSEPRQVCSDCPCSDCSCTE